MSFPALVQSAFLKALGWALLNSLWQFALLWLIFLVLINARKGMSSGLKHGLALLLLSIGSGWFMLELSLEYFAFSESLDLTASGYFLPRSTFSDYYLAAREFLEQNLVYVSSVYLLVVSVLFIQFFLYYYHSRIIRTRGLTKARAHLRLYVQQQAQHLGIRRKVQVWISERVNTPMIIGYFKPMILVPMACINQLSADQLEAILLHELAHIKRNDYLINLFVATTEVLFFFNPFSRLFVRIIKQERETSCDDWVLQFRFDAHRYASALLSLEKSRSAGFSTALSATGETNNILLYRIQRILKVKTIERNSGTKFFAYLLAIALFHFVAFVNPGRSVVTTESAKIPAERVRQGSFETDGLIRVQPVSLRGTDFSKAAAKSKPSKTPPAKASDAPRPGLDEAPEENELALMVNVDNNAETNLLPSLISTINVEERDYSIMEKDQAPRPVIAYGNEYPFVPHSSFSFQDTEDTTKPKRKTETYQERQVREALLKAKMAVEKIDWKNLEKQFDQTDLVKVRKAIEQSLEHINWNQINEEVRQTLNKENTQRLKAEYDELKNYKLQQQQYQKLQDELRNQTEKYKRDVERKEWEINKQLSKIKTVVHI